MRTESKRFFRIKITRDDGTSFEKLIYAETEFSALENCLMQNRGIQPDRKKYQKVNLNK